MDTFASLERMLTKFEKKWFSTLTLSGKFPAPSISPIVNGAVQFVVLQEPSRADKYNPLPVICVVGINYTQDPKNLWNKWSPYLPSSTNLKIPTIQDFGLGRSMRNPLDLMLDAYGRNQTAWEQPARGNKPSSTIPAYRPLEMRSSADVHDRTIFIDEVFDASAELDALLPDIESALEIIAEAEIQGLYEPGEEYAFYRDLSSLLLAASRDILIVDAYIDEKVFNLWRKAALLRPIKHVALLIAEHEIQTVEAHGTCSDRSFDPNA
jgi:hypothetical protein